MGGACPLLAGTVASAHVRPKGGWQYGRGHVKPLRVQQQRAATQLEAPLQAEAARRLLTAAGNNGSTRAQGAISKGLLIRPGQASLWGNTEPQPAGVSALLFVQVVSELNRGTAHRDRYSSPQASALPPGAASPARNVKATLCRGCAAPAGLQAAPQCTVLPAHASTEPACARGGPAMRDAGEGLVVSPFAHRWRVNRPCALWLINTQVNGWMGGWVVATHMRKETPAPLAFEVSFETAGRSVDTSTQQRSLRGFYCKICQLCQTANQPASKAANTVVFHGIVIICGYNYIFINTACGQATVYIHIVHVLLKLSIIYKLLITVS